MEKFYSHVLKSEVNGHLYKGSTSNLNTRLEWHNSGMVKYTSKYMPWKLVLFEEHETRSAAMRREKWYKTGVGRDWIKKELIMKGIEC